MNKQTLDKPLIYFSKEIERAVGINYYFSNVSMCCIEHSYIVDVLIENGVNVFCLAKHNIFLEHNSSSQLLKHKAVKDWIQKTVDGEFYAMTFLPTSSFSYHINQIGGTLLGTDYSLYLKFENKISQVEELAKANVSTVPNILKEFESTDFELVSHKFGLPFVVQTQRSHTGSGTFKIQNLSDFENHKTIFSGQKLKYSKYIAGQTFTINGLVTPNQVMYGPIQFQITNQKLASQRFGTTVGNDLSIPKEILPQEIGKEIEESVLKVAEHLKQIGYRGLFGLDCIVENANVFVIEINARQTANIPFEAARCESAGYDSLLKMNIEQWIRPNTIFEQPNWQNIEGSQLFVRMDSANNLRPEIQSGVYSKDSKINKKLFWSKDLNKDEYLVTKNDRIKIDNPTDEFARIQSVSNMVDSNGEIIEEIKKLFFI